MKTLSLLLFVLPFVSFGQTPIDVTDQTIKISGMDEHNMYFGFAEGDQILFTFIEIDGKELKEVEIIEYPTASKFADFKTSKIEGKSINVLKKGVYQFRFFNGSLSGRICKIKIQRIPSDDQTRQFDTNITWTTKQDTTWTSYTKDVLVSADTTYRQFSKKELVKTELREELLFDKSQRVHSTSNENGNKTWVFFSLPQHQQTAYQTKKVISWAYWVGVGDEANQAWAQNCKLISGLAEAIAGMYTTPLGAHAVGAVTNLILPKMGEDVGYAISDETNKNAFMNGYEYRAWDSGTGVAGYKKFIDPVMCSGQFFVLLSNDNYVEGIDATIKVIAMVETKTYEDKDYVEQTITPLYEKKIFSDPVITTKKIPVIGN